MSINFKKISFFVAIIAMVAFIMPSCEKDSVSEKDSKKDKDEQVDDNGGNSSSGSSNSAQCWEMVFTIEDYYQDGSGDTFEFSYYTWGTKQEAIEIAEAMAGQDEESSMTFEIKSAGSSEQSCSQQEEFIDPDFFWDNF